MIVCLIIGISGMTGNMQEEAIDNVKAMVFYEGVTYEELLNTYIVNPEWTAFNSENDIVIVEMNGTSIENDQVCIQFSGEMGMGFNGVGQQDFKLRYFDINGESLDPVGAMEYIYNYNPQ
jgi:sulfur carrier protein ThiS